MANHNTMQPTRQSNQKNRHGGRGRRMARARRGHAIIIALALVLGLTLFVVATERMVIQQFGVTKTERDFERALQLAEAGANAYLNMRANGEIANNVYLPVKYTGTLYSIQSFKQHVKDTTDPIYSKIRFYPNTGTLASPSQRNTFYCVYETGITSGGLITVVSYGWSNGVVRRVQLTAQSTSIFDWAAIYGLDDISTNSAQDYAWKFTGSANVVGAAGGEGFLVSNNNVTFYDGPVIWANGSYTAPYNNADPTVLASSTGTPTGHTGSPGLASPLYRHYVRKLNVETADSAAISYAKDTLGVTTTQGVEYFRTHNNNATGIRLLVKNTTTNVYRELATPYVIPTTGNKAYHLVWPSNGDYSSAGIANGEVAVGIRIYPGNYFFTGISQQTSDVVYYRTYNDWDRTNATFSPARVITVSSDPANPNTGADNGTTSANRNIRFWIGHESTGNDSASGFSYQNYMEYTKYASRLRMYVASSGGVSITGTNSNPPPPFRVNLLAYNNKDINGNTVASYGDVSFTSSTYLYGSLLGWRITVGGSTTIEKEAPEVGPDDRTRFGTTAWKELQ